MLDANKLLAHEMDGDLFLGDETVGRHHQRSDEHAAQEQKLRAGPQALEHRQALAWWSCAFRAEPPQVPAPRTDKNLDITQRRINRVLPWRIQSCVMAKRRLQASKPKGNTGYRFGNASILSANRAFVPQSPCCQGAKVATMNDIRPSRLDQPLGETPR